jgi:hypothetical protein
VSPPPPFFSFLFCLLNLLKLSCFCLSFSVKSAENHIEIVKLDGVIALVILLKSEDNQSGRYAAFALANIAANANHRTQVVEEGKALVVH